MIHWWGDPKFLSSNAQDFIEDHIIALGTDADPIFLSSNAQDFIEDRSSLPVTPNKSAIPEQ